MNEMKIIVAHPGRQHSFRLASALKKNDMLLYYVTTIYNKDSSLFMKIIKKFLSKDNLKRANGRKNPDLDDNDVKQYCLFGGLIEAFLARVDKTHYIYRIMQRYDAKRLGIKVAKLAIKENADAVIMYDSNAREGFEYLKKKAPNIVRILDVSIASRPYMKEIYQKEIEASGNTDLQRENQYMWNYKHIQASQQEIDNSQYFLSASSFVKESLKYCGADENSIKIVPYGANVSSNIKRSPIPSGKTIEILFVGQVIYRKGISYLLEAVAELDNVHLTVTGAYNSNDWFVKKYSDNPKITFTGLVTFDRMQKIYEQANIFVIPSFAEGMAQVGIEAMACGLPIICTHNSGVSDLVEDGETGFIIPCGDKEAIKTKLQWFAENPQRIVKMGKEAQLVAKNYSWPEYEKKVVQVIKEIVT